MPILTKNINDNKRFLNFLNLILGSIEWMHGDLWATQFQTGFCAGGGRGRVDWGSWGRGGRGRRGRRLGGVGDGGGDEGNSLGEVRGVDRDNFLRYWHLDHCCWYPVIILMLNKIHRMSTIKYLTSLRTPPQNLRLISTLLHFLVLPKINFFPFNFDTFGLEGSHHLNFIDLF